MAVAIVSFGIFAVHVKTILVPKTASKDDVSITDIVELNIVDARDGGNLLKLLDKETLHVFVAGVESGVVRHVSLIVISRLAETVYSIPALRLAALNHSGHPSMIFQTHLLSHLCSRTDLLCVHSSIDAYTCDAMHLPSLEVSSKRFLSSVLSPSRPCEYRDVLTFGACAKRGKHECQCC